MYASSEHPSGSEGLTSILPVLGSRRAVQRTRQVVVLGTAAITGVVAILVDWAILATPALILAVVAGGLGAVVYFQMESRALEQQLRVARVRSVEASDAERRRIQRDLHDSAQQRLVSVRIHLAMMAERMPGDVEREKVEELGRDLDAALGEIRSVTLAGYPDSVLRKGVSASLQAFAAGAPVPVAIEAEGLGRLPPGIERGVYFCCLEALQNVVKHGGRSATARIRLRREADMVVFEVEDSGRGFDPAHVEPGEGLVNIADRVALLQGHLTIDSRPGLGTRVRGDIPLN